MDQVEAHGVIVKLLGEEDSERFIYLASRLDDELISREDFATLSSELKDMLVANDIHLFMQYSKENKFNSLGLIVVHNGEIINKPKEG